MSYEKGGAVEHSTSITTQESDGVSISRFEIDDSKRFAVISEILIENDRHIQNQVIIPLTDLILFGKEASLIMDSWES